MAPSDSVRTGQALTRLVAERPLVPGDVTWFALDQQVDEGWHVYWKNPGDSGLALELNWTLPQGITAGEVAYPSPERIPVGPLVNFGFHGSPIFLIPISVPASAAPGTVLDFSLDATWLICEDVCIPEDASFRISVPVAGEVSSYAAEAPLFQKARDHLPEALAATSEFYDDGAHVVLKVSTDDIKFGDTTAAFFFPAVESSIIPAEPQTMTINGNALSLQMKPDFAYQETIKDQLAGVLQVEQRKGPARSFEISASRTNQTTGAGTASEGGTNSSPTLAGTNPTGTNPGSANLPLLLLFAFLGGIILNIMPCVFPILFIKASSLLSSAQEDKATIRQHGWLYTAGVVATFALIGGILLILRAQGERLGWGFHLQSPLMVGLSAYVLFLVGLNLAGLFHVGTSLQGVGEGLSRKQGAWGSFFTGALAVVVAAPCIGPLLSAPMGAAVLLPPFWGMLIFILMALGLAFPYLAISLIPSIGKYLPKPGAWMETLKQFLSFPVFAGAAYFLWVLTAQTGTNGLAVALAGGLALALAAWLFEQGRAASSLSLFQRGAAAILVVLSLLPLTRLTPVTTTAVAGAGSSHGALSAIPFDREEISRLNGQGEDVFVDFTAAWCVTCQFNKLTVFSSPSLAKAFEEYGTVFMVADWTVRDPKITAALQEFGMSGVPLYVHYPANGTPAVIGLPLTERAIIEQISRDAPDLARL